MNKVELLAPAGSFEGFIGALNAGADAFYLAGNKFGARAYADNFTDEELINALNIAHLFGKRVYLTLNTLVKEREMCEIFDFIKPLYDNHLDGIIVQDLGVLLFLNENFPDLKIHLSTQMSIVGSFAPNMLKKYNVTRIVPARELSLSEIVEIKKNTGLEIETFIHGAMCYCYSGNCLMSSFLGGRSGNRGRCAQPCRLPYYDGHKNEVYPLSMKDMCTLGIIPQLIQSGIDSFKIEGRMKKSSYSAGVTSIYRKYIDKYYEGSFAGIEEEDFDTLKNLYIRSELSEGYYNKYNGKDMITLSSPSYNGADEEVLSNIEDEFINKKPKINIEGYAFFNIGKECVLTVTEPLSNVTVSVTGPYVEKAQNVPLSVDKIKEQLNKTTDTFFSFSKLCIESDDSIFLGIKFINELRRNALQKLFSELVEWNTKYMLQ